MKASKKHKVIREGDPLFEKLKSQLRPEIAKGLKTITLLKCNDEWEEGINNDGHHKRHSG
ncbi:MAG: hypothetical protein ACE5PV_24330 [Candidatus Poribacteria bacterium]